MPVEWLGAPQPDHLMSLSTGVLVVDNRPAERQAVIALLRGLGHRPRSADSVAAAARLLAKEGIGVALLSLGTADPDAFGSLRRLRSASPTMAILLLAPAAEAARAAQLLRHGA